MLAVCNGSPVIFGLNILFLCKTIVLPRQNNFALGRKQNRIHGVGVDGDHQGFTEIRIPHFLVPKAWLFFGLLS